VGKPAKVSKDTGFEPLLNSLAIDQCEGSLRRGFARSTDLTLRSDHAIFISEHAHPIFAFNTTIH